MYSKNSCIVASLNNWPVACTDSWPVLAPPATALVRDHQDGAGALGCCRDSQLAGRAGLGKREPWAPWARVPVSPWWRNHDWETASTGTLHLMCSGFNSNSSKMAVPANSLEDWKTKHWFLWTDVLKLFESFLYKSAGCKSYRRELKTCAVRRGSCAGHGRKLRGSRKEWV